MLEQLLVGQILFRHFGILRILGLGGAEECLQGDQGGPDGECRRPFVLQDVETDGPGHAADVRVPDLRLKAHLEEELRGIEGHLGRLEGVVRRDLDVYHVCAALVDSVLLREVDTAGGLPAQILFPSSV